MLPISVMFQFLYDLQCIMHNVLYNVRNFMIVTMWNHIDMPHPPIYESYDIHTYPGHMHTLPKNTLDPIPNKENNTLTHISSPKHKLAHLCMLKYL